MNDHIRPTNEYRLYARGRLAPAIPHYPRIVRALLTCSWMPNYEELARVLVRELKREGVKKVTIKAYKVHFAVAHKILRWVRGYREGCQHLEEVIPLEERVVMRLYNPHIKALKTAVTGARETTNIRLHRGEPTVCYSSKSGGRGRGSWETFHLDITVPKGWSYLARADKHIIPSHEGQERQLIIDYKPIDQPDLFAGTDWQQNWELAEVRVLKRRSGSRTLSDPVIIGRCGRVVVTAKEVLAVYSALPKAIVKSVVAALN